MKQTFTNKPAPSAEPQEKRTGHLLSSLCKGFGKGLWTGLSYTLRLMARFPALPLAAVVIAAAWWAFAHFSKPDVLSVQASKSIDVTPEEIEAIRDIGQWEFVSFQTEELTDTTDRHWYGDRKWARIYTGTLRIGIDLRKTRAGWFAVQGDTALITLPQPALLDKNFIDEARSRTFYIKGKWNAAAQKALYLKARSRMIRRGVTAGRLNMARSQARRQMTNLAKGLGFKTVIVSFEK